VTILFKKTHLYDSNCIIKTMDIINQYTNYLTHLNVNIPTTFNYPYFFSGIKSILESDHSFAISKVLMN
jgi:hypothetical protein